MIACPISFGSLIAVFDFRRTSSTIICGLSCSNEGTLSTLPVGDRLVKVCIKLPLKAGFLASHQRGIVMVRASASHSTVPGLIPLSSRATELQKIMFTA